MYDWDSITYRARLEGLSPHLPLKECLQLFVLDYLFKKGVFSHLVFQGGTALRIVYGGVRYSEDLDFVLCRKDKMFLEGLPKTMEGLPSYLDKSLPFTREIKLKRQKETPGFLRFTLIVKVEGLEALDKTHIEIMNVPSYDNEIILIQRADIPVHPAVRVETKKEILSDKYCAFGSRQYVKGRDIWDIHFLTKNTGMELDKEGETLVKKKIADYGFTPREFKDRYQKNLSLFREKGNEILVLEMERFLPRSYQESYKEEYAKVTGHVLKLLNRFYDEVLGS